MDSRRSSIGHMSTPLRENNRKYSHSSLLSPGSSRLIKNRYCISDTSSPNSKILNNYSPGPLLTPTDYNTNLSTYIDCKSPGLSSRIVQYSSDAVDKTEPFVSHQAKYGSPGIFPIVHLQKKSLPVRKLPRDSVTVRLIATHESPSYSGNSNGVSTSDTDPSDISTSSVLKALRAISKKRVLSEDITVAQNNHKRQRNDCQIDNHDLHADINNLNNINVSNSSKNSFDDIPCVVDALAASLTSSNSSLANSQNTLKRKINKTSPDTTPTKSLKHTLIEVETQTDNLKVTSVTQTIEDESKVEESIILGTTTAATNTTPTTEIDIHAKVYENSLKNKLAVTLAAFTGAKPSLPNSILSPPDKPKHDKHVTFDLPDDTAKRSVDEIVSTIGIPVLTTSDKVGLTTSTPLNSLSSTTEVSSASAAAPLFSQVVTVVPDVVATITATTETPKLATALTTPTTSVTFSTPLGLPKLSSPLFTANTAAPNFLSGSNHTNKELLNTTSSEFGSLTSTEPRFITSNKVTIPTTSAPFGLVPKLLGKDPVVTSTAGTTFSPLPEQKLLTEATTFPLVPGFSSQNAQKLPNEKPLSFESPPSSKPGGFKFDLGGTSNEGLIGNSTSTVTKVEPSFNFISTSKPAPNINFGSNTTVTSAFGASSIFSTGFETSTAPNVGFTIPKQLAPVTDIKSTFTSPVVTASQPLPTFNFGAKIEPAVSVFNTLPQATSNSNIFKFGPTSTSTIMSNFPPPVSINTTQGSSNSNAFKFGGSVTTTPSIFNAPTFSKPEESNNMFKFGPSAFNSSPAFKDTKPPLSESASTSFNFATPATTASTFNKVQPPNDSSAFKFAGSATSVVVQPPNDSSAFKFGASTVSAASVQPPNQSGAFKFGESGIGATVAQLPNESSAFKFGGSTNNVAVVQPNDSNAFKFSAPTTNAAAVVFNKPSFNTSGQNEQSIFKFSGPSVTTAAAPMFNSPAFNFTAPVSKAAPPNFSTTTASFNNFGQFESKPANPFNSSAFGDTKSTVPFGTSQTFGAENKPAASIFGTATQNENVFGNFNNNQTPFGVGAPSSQPAFGTPAPPLQSAPSQPFQFGASTNNPQTNVFSFGAGNEPAKPAPSSGVFSFGTTTTNNNTFGTTPAPTFGTPVAPNPFGMQPPNFGSAIQGAPMFSIGTGSSTPKTRTQLKARRRT